MLVENYSNSRSLQTPSAAEAIFSGLRAKQHSKMDHENNASLCTILTSRKYLNQGSAFLVRKAGDFEIVAQLSFQDA